MPLIKALNSDVNLSTVVMKGAIMNDNLIFLFEIDQVESEIRIQNMTIVNCSFSNSVILTCGCKHCNFSFDNLKMSNITKGI